ADVGNTHTYTLVSGPGSTDNASFNISGNNLRISTSPDFETKSSYSIRIRTTDNSGGTYEKSFTISVTGVNEAPILSAIGNKTVGEMSLLTFTATATDPDLPANTLTFSLVNAPTGASINMTTGVFTWWP